MFFLGISANIIIYLLVPALFVVCFYFSGEPETHDFVGNICATTIYSPRDKQLSAQETYFYNGTIQEQKKRQEEKPHYYIIQLRLPAFFPIFYYGPSGKYYALRAPPSHRI